MATECNLTLLLVNNFSKELSILENRKVLGVHNPLNNVDHNELGKTIETTHEQHQF